MVLSEILTRKIPFSEYKKYQYEDEGKVVWKNNGFDIQREITNNNLRPTIPRNIPEELINLIENCWDLKPEKRLQSFECVKVLEGILKNLGVNIIYKLEEEQETNKKTSNIRTNSNFLMKEEELTIQGCNCVTGFVQVEEEIWILEKDGSISCVDPVTLSVNTKFVAHKGVIEHITVVKHNKKVYVCTYSNSDMQLCVWKYLKKKPKKKKSLSLDKKIMFLSSVANLIIIVESSGEIKIMSNQLNKSEIGGKNKIQFNCSFSCFYIEQNPVIEVGETELPEESLSNSDCDTEESTSESNNLRVSNSIKSETSSEEDIFKNISEMDVEKLIGKYNLLNSNIDRIFIRLKKMGETIQKYNNSSQEYQTLM